MLVLLWHQYCRLRFDDKYKKTGQILVLYFHSISWMFVLDDYLQMAIFMDVQFEDDDGETS